MTDHEAIQRLIRMTEKHEERLRTIETQRSAEAERWKQASADITSIKDELKQQTDDQRKRFNTIGSIVVIAVISAFMKWVIDGGLSGYQ